MADIEGVLPSACDCWCLGQESTACPAATLYVAGTMNAGGSLNSAVSSFRALPACQPCPVALREASHFHCRPDQHRWRAFGALSGGQKALATLALLLALQAALPSPLYFFDEARASRTACVMRAMPHFLA